MTAPFAACEPELVTGWVDDALDPATAERIGAHVAACPRCQEQAEGERRVTARLRDAMPPQAPTASLAPRLRTRLRQRTPIRWARVLVPLAATVLLAFGWVRSTPSFLAWELSRDHDHCFGRPTLPAKVWTGDMEIARLWFEQRGTAMPILPAVTGRLQLVGGRYCPLAGLSREAHLYYAGEGEDAQMSVYVVERPLLLARDATRVVGSKLVVIRRYGGATIGIVAPHKADLDSIQEALDTTVAWLESAPAAR